MLESQVTQVIVGPVTDHANLKSLRVKVEGSTPAEFHLKDKTEGGLEAALHAALAHYGVTDRTPIAYRL